MWAKLNEKASSINKDGLTIAGAAQYLCEHDTDVETLPKDNVPTGSSAMVIDSGNVFILGPSKTWIKYKGVSTFNGDI